MDVWRIMVAALRRWYVLVPVLALTGVAMVLASNQVAPEYEARASAMVAPPGELPDRINPYVTLESATQVLQIVLNSSDTHRMLTEQGLSSSYEVGVGARTTVFTITARAEDAEVAKETVVALLERASDELSYRQGRAEIPSSGQYVADVLEPPEITAVIDTREVRVQAVIGILGAGLAVLLAVLFDDIIGLVRRARYRPQRASVRTGDPNEAPNEAIDDTANDSSAGDAPTVQMRFGSAIPEATALHTSGELPRRSPPEPSSYEQESHRLGASAPVPNPLFDAQIGNPWSIHDAPDRRSDDEVSRQQ